MKLSPNVTSIAQMARVCEGEGADALSLVNAVQGMLVDVQRRRTVLRNGLGGLSGPAIFPIALRMVWQASRAVRIPICGIGGIQSGEDAVAFLLCGASAVQVGTIGYTNPRAASRSATRSRPIAARKASRKSRELIGGLRPWEAPEA